MSCCARATAVRSLAVSLATLLLLAATASAEPLPLDVATSGPRPVRSAVRVVEAPPALQSRTVRAPMPFRALALRWLGRAPAPLEPDIWLRFSNDGESWTEWMLPRIDPDGVAADAFTVPFALLFLDSPHQQVEYAASAAWLDAGAQFEFTFVDPGETSPIDPARAGVPVLAQSRLARPATVSRVAWGCPDGETSPDWIPEYTAVTHVIVHHTAMAEDTTDWSAVVRSIWAIHTYTRGWGDIGYNFLIDPLGAIYEGRNGGDDVIGAHFSCQNSHTTGVVLLGDYESVAPTPAALDSLVRLLAWKVRESEIDPLGTTEHPGTRLVLDAISGHRDGNASSTTCSTTACPGDRLYALLPEIRMAVAAAVAAPEPGASSGGVAGIASLCIALRLRKRGRRGRVSRQPATSPRCRDRLSTGRRSRA